MNLDFEKLDKKNSRLFHELLIDLLVAVENGELRSRFNPMEQKVVEDYIKGQINCLKIVGGWK